MGLVLGTTRPVARRDHICELCGRKIQPGETYLRLRIIGDDGPYVWKECAHCRALFRLIDLDYDQCEGYTVDDFYEYEPATWTEARWLVHFRRRWTRPDGSLYPAPSPVAGPSGDTGGES